MCVIALKSFSIFFAALLGQAVFLVATGYLGNCNNPLVAVALITAAQVNTGKASQIITINRESVVFNLLASLSITLTLHHDMPARYLVLAILLQLLVE